MPRRTSICLLVLLFTGCVEQTLTIQSDPPGALVYLNDQEVGRTPFTRNFTWYGDYDVEVRKDGYETIKTHQMIKTPLYLWPPFDLIAELQPTHVVDRRELFYKMQPEPLTPPEPGPVMSRAEELRSQLESSKLTRTPTTKPTSHPTTHP